MKKELFEKLAMYEVNTLRRMDIQRGLIGENYEPFNGRLSAKENERCWKCLAKPYVENIQITYLLMFGDLPDDEELFEGWKSFLRDVNNVVKCGDLNGHIKDIINASGISEETWVKFLD